jgi:CheY-like chemotaxis protein
LAFVRRREERREPIAPEELAERVTLALNKEFDRAGVRLLLDFGPDLPRITGDSVGLEQVLTNLLDNARRASGAQGVVRLSARTTPDGLELIVEDSGPGIPEEVLHRIFEPFFTTRPAGQGTGLGLSVSLGIVEQHGGSLRAENRSPPEKGARFTALLPFGLAAEDRRLAPRQQTLPAATPPAPAPPRVVTGARSAVRIPRVLLIDDEAPVRAAMRRFFERKGWKVDEAGDGSEGLDLLLTAELSKPYDVVISDLKMPGVSGIELHRRLASSHPALLRRLVIATGDTASAAAAEFLTRTACPVLEKPFELSDLSRVVERVLAESPIPS